MPFKIPALSRTAWSLVLPIAIAIPTGVLIGSLLSSPASVMIASCIFGSVLGYNGDRIADVLIPALKLPVKPE